MVYLTVKLVFLDNWDVINVKLLRSVANGKFVNPCLRSGFRFHSCLVVIIYHLSCRQGICRDKLHHIFFRKLWIWQTMYRVLFVLLVLVLASVTGRLASPSRNLEDGWKNYIPDDDNWKNFIPDDDGWKQNWKDYIPDDDSWKSKFQNWGNFGNNGGGNDDGNYGGDDSTASSYSETTKQNLNDMFQSAPQNWTSSEWITFSLLLFIFGGLFCCCCLCWIIPKFCCGKTIPATAYAAMP